MFFDEYYLLEYIQSSGTQYIDTGIIANPTTQVLIEASMLTKGSYNVNHLFGAGSSNSGEGFGSNDFLFGQANQSYYYRAGSSATTHGIGDTNQHIFNVYANGRFSVDETEYTSTSVLTGQGTKSIFLFRSNIINYSGYTGNNKINYCKIYDNGNLVRNFVPVKRKTDNVLGLYDLVNNAFYTNAGTGTFTAGHIVDVSVNPIGSGTISIETSGNNTILTANANAGYEFENWTLDGYTQLEYIQSSGTQYINAGFGASNKEYKIEVTLAWTDISTEQGMGFSANTGQFFEITSSGRYFPTNVEAVVGRIDTIEFVRGVSSSTYKVNGQSGSANISTQVSNTLGIFSMMSTSASYPMKAKIYSVKAYDNNVLIRDFIPVIRHSDAQIGLLDLVNLKFYGNSGAGEFIGGDVYAS